MKHGIFLLLAIPFLTACGNDKKSEPLPPEGPSGRATGRVGGSPFTASSAIARITSSGYDITVAGFGEQLDCTRQFPSQAHLSFRAPAQNGRYEFDLANPGNSSSPVSFIFPAEGGADVVISRSSVIEIRSFAGGRVSGAVFAESSQAGSRGGNITGSFDAEICGNGPSNPARGAIEELAEIEGEWMGLASVTSGSYQSDRNVSFRLKTESQGTRIFTTFSVVDAVSREIYWSAGIYASNAGFEQVCVPRGESQPVFRRVGSYSATDQTFRIGLLAPDCTELARYLQLNRDSSGRLNFSSSVSETDRALNRGVQARGFRRF